jgi:hypothetical protein
LVLKTPSGDLKIDKTYYILMKTKPSYGNKNNFRSISSV